MVLILSNLRGVGACRLNMGWTWVDVPNKEVPCDGYVIAYQAHGDLSPGAARVMGMHGMPGSRIRPLFAPALLEAAGVNLVMPDRLGYGKSSRRIGRTIADSADMARRVADDLGWDTFAVVGHSGGVASALACAALLPERVSEAHCSNGMAPMRAMGPAWFEGMAPRNARVFSPAITDAEAMRMIDQEAFSLKIDSGRLLRGLRKEIAQTDHAYLDDSAEWNSLQESHDEAVRQGTGGWVDDVLALRRDWGFSLSDIRVPVHFAQAAEDRFTPVAHAKWMQQQIPGSTLEIVSGLPHFAPALSILGRLAAGRRLHFAKE